MSPRRGHVNSAHAPKTGIRKFLRSVRCPLCVCTNHCAGLPNAYPWNTNILPFGASLFCRHRPGKEMNRKDGLEVWRLGSLVSLEGLRPTPLHLSFKREDDGREGAISGRLTRKATGVSPSGFARTGVFAGTSTPLICEICVSFWQFCRRQPAPNRL